MNMSITMMQGDNGNMKVTPLGLSQKLLLEL